MSVWEKIEKILNSITYPSQYIGAEINSIRKDHTKVKVKFLFAFPDTYTIGMSHLGLQIIYSLLNSLDDVVCERVFAPWPDMETKMRHLHIPLFSVDSHTPAKDFDIIGFSLQTEHSYSNVINMLELAKVPLLRTDRTQNDPLILGGGPCASYPEPLAEFFDLFLIGDAEDALVKLIQLYKELKGEPRDFIIKEIVCKLTSFYAPGFYNFKYSDEKIRAIVHDNGLPDVINKASVESLDHAHFPLNPIVPYSGVVFDRIDLEIMRGCPHHCRFCHAASFKNKLRFRSVDMLIQHAETIYQNTGHDEISLLSLSTGDYPYTKELLTKLSERFAERRITISVPSLRINGKIRALPSLMTTGRRTGFTIAPEAGTETLRKIIRKPISNQDLFEAVRSLFSNGLDHLKLYFMIGLPGEKDEDILELIKTIKDCHKIARDVRGRFTVINVTISPFVPKPHTPFQFCRFSDFEYLNEVIKRLRYDTHRSGIQLKFHNPESSYLEAVLAIGDRRIAKAIQIAHSKGCKFDDWSEYFSFEKWMDAFLEAGINPDLYARREREKDEILPWDHINIGPAKSHLWEEFTASRQLATQRSIC